MKIAIVTVDLFPGREMLMPWRYVLEVASFLSDSGHEVEVLNQEVSYRCDNPEFKRIQTKKVSRDVRQLTDYLAINKYEVLIYPVPWRETLKNQNGFKNLKCKKIAYMPGGVYALRNILMLWFQCGISSIKPFLLDYLTPGWLYTLKLKRYHFDGFVGLTPLTSNKVQQAGFKNVYTILPGKDDFESIPEVSDILQQYRLKNRKYYLYTGNSDFTRGTGLLASILNEFVRKVPDALVLFLLRNDVGSENERLLRKLKKVISPESFIVINEKLNKNQLKSLIKHSRAVLLPFIIVPSEIPLTFIEVLGIGTPVITMTNEGTTDYLKGVVLSGKSRGELLNNMCRLWTDDKLYHQLEEQSHKKNSNHPSWDDSGEAWNQLIKNLKS